MQSFGPMPGMPIPGMPLVPMGLPGHGPGSRSAAGMPFFERPFPIVRLRGLPFNAGELDIFEFFQGLDPVDVLLLRRDGRNTGEAYVLFGTAMQMDFALQKNRASMGRRYIEVFRAKKTDYYAAVCAYVADPPPPLGYHSEAGPLEGDAAVPGAQPPASGVGAGGVRATPVTRPDVAAPQPHTGVLKMRGLPFSATKDDIISFFDDESLGVPPLVHDSIHIVTSLDGRPSGVAFAEFASPEDAKAAMRKDRSSMGSRYVELFASSREEATRAATAAR